MAKVKKRKKVKKVMAQPTPSVPAGQPPQSGGLPVSDRLEVIPIIETIEKLRGTRVITYFLSINASIADDAMPCFYDQLRAVRGEDAIDLWISSRGGTTEVPWRIVQMVRARCKRFGVLVTEVALSAATHIALGADEIVMGPFSVLSPVDPQRRHPLLPTDAKGDPLPFSVQDLKHVVEFVKREAPPTGLSSEAYAQVIAALFDKIHPLALGAIEQSYALSKIITRRMLATHMEEATEAEQIDKLADSLCDDYKSHTFPIGLLEAKRLGLKVNEASDELYDAMWALMRYYSGIDRQPKPVPAGSVAGGQSSQGKLVYQPIGHIDSTAARFDCIGISEVAKDGTVQARGSPWIPLPVSSSK